MPKPAHSHPQSSLQSVWDVGRYLSRYPVAGVAFEAPGTCKQCTPQITVTCGGATFGAGTGCRQVSHLQTAQPLEGHFSRNTTWPELLSSLGTRYPAAEAPLCSKLNHSVQQTVRGRLTWQCYSARSNNPEGTSVVQSTSEAQVVPALHKHK